MANFFRLELEDNQIQARYQQHYHLNLLFKTQVIIMVNPVLALLIKILNLPYIALLLD